MREPQSARGLGSDDMNINVGWQPVRPHRSDLGCHFHLSGQSDVAWCLRSVIYNEWRETTELIDTDDELLCVYSLKT